MFETQSTQSLGVMVMAMLLLNDLLHAEKRRRATLLRRICQSLSMVEDRAFLWALADSFEREADDLRPSPNAVYGSREAEESGRSGQGGTGLLPRTTASW